MPCYHVGTYFLELALRKSFMLHYWHPLCSRWSGLLRFDTRPMLRPLNVYEKVKLVYPQLLLGLPSDPPFTSIRGMFDWLEFA